MIAQYMLIVYVSVISVALFHALALSSSNSVPVLYSIMPEFKILGAIEIC